MTHNDTTPDKVTASFKLLQVAATRLNSVSDELSKSIDALDSALKRLNLGVPAWVKIAGDFDANTGYFWARELGYARIGPKWGIALRTRDGDAGDPSHESVEEWLFGDAPRKLRLEAISKLPQLLEELVKQADSIAEKIKDKIGEAQQVAQAITPPAQRVTTAFIGPTSTVGKRK